MTFLGIWSCQWRELRPIKFGGNGSTANQAQTAGTADNDGLESHARGRGRGRNRDGGGDYEMVEMKEAADEAV